MKNSNSYDSTQNCTLKWKMYVTRKRPQRLLYFLLLSFLPKLLRYYADRSIYFLVIDFTFYLFKGSAGDERSHPLNTNFYPRLLLELE